ncbi:MAG: HAMP domain-containing sensor histidine kinase [Rhodothermales bacterium]
MSSARPDEQARPNRPRWIDRARQAGRRNALGLRLTLGYALLFALSAAVLFGLTYALLGSILRQQDDALVETQLRAAEQAYARDGLAGVRRIAASLRGDDRGEELLFRIADSENRTLLLVPPDEWEPADLVELERLQPVPGERIRLWSDEEEQEVEVVTRLLVGGGSASDLLGGFLQVGISSDERDDVLESFPRVFLIITIPLLLFALLGGAFMAHRALRPIRRLVTTLDAIVATGDVRERAPAPAEQGEFADLFRLFNRMLDRIEALVGRLRGTLDDVAHDLRTPLTRVRSAADLALQRERGGGAYREALAQVLAATETASATLDAIMDVAEAESGAMRLDLEPVPVSELVHDVVGFYDLAAEEKGVRLETRLDQAVTVTVDRSRMRQALANLIDNAVKYTPPGGHVTVEAERVEVGRESEEVRIAVRDTGPGIPDEDAERIWERHYRGEGARHERGLGLGLSLVRAVVESHGGRVEVQSRPGEGSAFVVCLPGGSAA